MRLFEAARWAPSTYNEQEWRFLYAANGRRHWPTFFGLLMEANQLWCKNASVLVVVLSHKVFTRNGNPNPVHTFDAGLASQNLLLQGPRWASSATAWRDSIAERPAANSRCRTTTTWRR